MENKETNEKMLKKEKNIKKNQEASMEIMKKGFDTMNAGITYLINQNRKSNNESIISTNTVKALELKATNQRIDKYEEIINELIIKIEEQKH